MFPCPFSHNTTLQHHRLPSVTKDVTTVVLRTEKNTALEGSPNTEISDVCLHLCNRVRIFRGGVQVSGSATYFSRPTPTGSEWITRRASVDGASAKGRRKPPP